MATKRKRLYLVDGTSQLFRAYFAIRGLTNADGLPTNAVYGFTTMLRKLMNEEKPEYLAVAFDLGRPTFRHDRYADYKANRPPIPEDLGVQVPLAKEVCGALQVPVLEREGYEADDLIATYAQHARASGFEVVVVASDKDLLQLVREGVSVLNPSRNERLDAPAVAESFGVAPEHVKDVLGLMGDSVDNIPGVPGVGEKTAVAMVGVYGSLEAVLARAGLFVKAYDARDGLLAEVESLESETPPSSAGIRRVRTAASALVRALEELRDHERDDTFRVRLSAALGAVEDAGAADLEGDAPKRLRGLRRALRELDKGSGRRVWYAVHENVDKARLSLELATLDEDVPVEFDEQALKTGPPDGERTVALYRRLGFKSLVSSAGETAGPAEEGARAEPPALAHRTVLSRGTLEETVRAARVAGRLSLAVRCCGFDPLRARLVGIALSHAEGAGAYVPFGHDYLGAPAQLSLESVREVLGPVFADASVHKVGSDIKKAMHVLARHGIPVAGWDLDVSLAAFLLHPDRPGFEPRSLAAEHLGGAVPAIPEVSPRRGEFAQVDLEPATEDAAGEAEAVFRLSDVLAARMRSAGVDPLYRTVDAPLLPVLARMEALGIRVDVARLEGMSKEMEASLETSRHRIRELAGVELNPDSPKQLREVLFDRLGLKPGRTTEKTGVRSTDAATLEALSDEHEIAREILAYRELAKLKGTYVDALPRLVNPDTGRVHTTYNPTGAATGRLSSSDPNLQNIPVRTEAGMQIRAVFVPAPGHVFFASDYSQVELRVLAHLCGDPELLAAFRAGEDIHRVTASRVFGVAADLVTDTMRRRAKAVNFGILYGMSATRLARDQGMSRADASRFMRAYFERFRAVEAYVERVRAEASRDGEVRTLFGRVRYFPQLRSRSPRAVREQALRGAVNTTIQGTAADLMKMAMLRVEDSLTEAGLKARMVLQVHDELLLEVPREEVEAVRSLVRKAMEGVYALGVPLVVDQKVGGSWKDVT